MNDFFVVLDSRLCCVAAYQSDQNSNIPSEALQVTEADHELLIAGKHRYVNGVSVEISDALRQEWFDDDVQAFRDSLPYKEARRELYEDKRHLERYQIANIEGDVDDLEVLAQERADIKTLIPKNRPAVI